LDTEGGGGGGAPVLGRGGAPAPGAEPSAGAPGFFARLSKTSRSEPPWSLIFLGYLLQGDLVSRKSVVGGGFRKSLLSTLSQGLLAEPGPSLRIEKGGVLVTPKFRRRKITCAHPGWRGVTEGAQPTRSRFFVTLGSEEKSFFSKEKIAPSLPRTAARSPDRVGCRAPETDLI
jgi:hypothetical protein